MPPSLMRILRKKTNIQVIKLHLDNDRTGRSYTQAITRTLTADEDYTDYQVLDMPPPCGKDVNDYLMMKLKQIEERSQNGAGKNFIHEPQRA